MSKWVYAVRIRAKSLALYLLPIAIIVLSSAETALADEVRGRVLFISSYSYTWPTVPLQISGISSALGDRATLDTEFMDTKTINDSTGARQFYEHIKHKLSKVKPFDVVIAGDDAAFSFAVERRTELFPGTPVVFEAVNNLDRARAAAKDPMVTGVVEKFSYEDNINLALRINPHAKKIVALLDDTVTGKGDQQQFYAQKEKYPQLAFCEINTSKLTKDEIVQAMRELSDDTIFCYLIMSEDSEKNIYSNSEVVSLISRYSPVPAWRFVQAGIGEGVLGGNIVSHEESGRIAGRMALQIISGTPCSMIPIDFNSPNRYMIDQKVVDKFNIDMALIPKGAHIVNYKPSFWEEYGTVILVTSAIAAALILLIIIIQRMLMQKRQSTILQKKNEELAFAVAQADRANAAKSQFLSRMSHEIRTPLNAVVGLTTIAKQNISDAVKTDEYLDKIEISSRMLLNIINDILDMSAIENNRLKIANVEFDIKQILNSTAAIYYPQCQDKGVRFEITTDLEDEMFIGDSMRVSQALLNLVSNACKFTERGGSVCVKVHETTRRENTAFVRFVVADTGVGMSKDMQKHLFKPFEQEEAGTARKYGGSGLGLSIAKNLIELMHGAISVESDKGVGTTFTVDLPFGIADNAHKQNAEQLRYVRCLVVDDDDSARKYTSIVLHRIGIQFDTAASGADALHMIDRASQEGHPYNVTLIDWRMPDMDGVELTQRIRSKEDKDKKSLIIIVSAYDINEVEDTAKAAGADLFVSKPLFQSTVFNALMALTSGSLHTDGPSEHNYDFTGKKVLLAEDNDMNADIATELMSMVNLDVDRAINGKEAVELFDKSAPGTYGAILMDIRMSEMDGYEATRTIRAMQRGDAATIPIFAMTADAFADDVSAALSVGMNEHIAKPIDTQRLYETLAKAMGLR